MKNTPEMTEKKSIIHAQYFQVALHKQQTLFNTYVVTHIAWHGMAWNYVVLRIDPE